MALTLRLLGGLTTPEIARAFLVSEPTVAQRIVRAKRTLAEAHVPFERAAGATSSRRACPRCSRSIYLIFNEGYAATAGDDWMRPALCEDALRLGRILAGLLPDEPEVHGLVALMEIQASRSRARVGAGGRAGAAARSGPRALGPGADQPRARPRSARAEALGGALGPYTLQAAIAACHARARTAQDTDWARIVALYDALAQLAPSPVVELNRAVAVLDGLRAGGRARARRCARSTSALDGYHLLPSVRGDMLAAPGAQSGGARRARARRRAGSATAPSSSCCASAPHGCAETGSRSPRPPPS